MIDVEPLIVSELERMLPLPDGSRANWVDVLHRAGMADARRGRRWRPVLVAAVVVAALVGVGIAIAAGFGAFNGISGAQHPQSAADRLDTKDLSSVCRDAPPTFDSPFCHLIPSSARFLRTVPGGGKLWIVTDTRGDLCVILERGTGRRTGSCGRGLTLRQPTTITSGRDSEQTPWLSWGITLDSVAAVSFPVGGKKVTVPVKDNVWFYESDKVGNLAAMTIHFKDGSTERPQSDTVPSNGG